MLASKQYTADGQLSTDVGDTIEVNGQLYPFLHVEPRKYRFRLLNGAATRTFMLQLHQEETTVDPQAFYVIASDAGYLEASIVTSTLRIAQGERYEIVIDFLPYAGTYVKLRNSDGNLIESDTLGQVLKFVVGKQVSSDANNHVPPPQLRDIEFLSVPTTAEKSFTFERK